MVAIRRLRTTPSGGVAGVDQIDVLGVADVNDVTQSVTESEAVSLIGSQENSFYVVDAVSFFLYLRQISVRDPVLAVPANTKQDDLNGKAPPVEHHVRVESMSTSRSCNARARLQGLLHNQPLLSSRTTLPYLPDQHTRSFHQLIIRPTSAHAPDGKITRLRRTCNARRLLQHSCRRSHCRGHPLAFATTLARLLENHPIPWNDHRTTLLRT